MSEKNEPQLIEATATVSLGGSIQLKQYEVSSKYHFGLSGKWTMPEGYDEKDAAEFRAEKIDLLLKEVDNFAQQEIDNLLEQKMELNR